jgi:N-acetylglucosaminyl-diphospho-decaprenol L-rhamnosyltransferase
VLGAVIVTYGTSAETAAAVASLRAQSHPPEEIVIIDHGAADGEPLVDSEALAGVRVERPEVNRGFGAGGNLGVRLTAAEEVLILNADVVLSEHAVEELRHRLRSDHRLGVVGPRILSGGELQLSARAFPRFRTGLLGRQSVLTRALVRARRYPAEFRHTSGGGSVDWVSGACMLVRRSAFDAVGGFDESYFMYWEDADLCRRLAAAGWHVHYEPSAVVHHATGASGTSERTIRAFHASAALFASRHLVQSPFQRLLVRALLHIREQAALSAYRRASRRGP